MKALLFDAIELNNIAVEYMFMGRYTDAVSSLVTAYISERENIRPRPKEQKKLWSHYELPDGFSILDHLMLSSDRPSLDQQPGRCTTTGGHHVYSRPISIPKLLPVDHEQTHAIVSICILFNLALAQHFTAMQLSAQTQGIEREELAKRALKLYRLAFHLQYFHQEQSVASGLVPRPSNILLLALMNNSGYTYELLGDSENASACFQHLFASLIWLRSASWLQPSAALDDPCFEKMIALFSQSTASWLVKNLPQVAAPAA